MFTVEKHSAPMTGSFWFMVTEDNNGLQVEGTPFYDDYDDAKHEAERRNNRGNFIDMLPDPKVTRESLYSALHEELGTWFDSMPGQDQGEIALSFANDLRETAKLIENTVKTYEKE
jgi:hypothetical protein